MIVSPNKGTPIYRPQNPIIIYNPYCMDPFKKVPLMLANPIFPTFHDCVETTAVPLKDRTWALYDMKHSLNF